MSVAIVMFLKKGNGTEEDERILSALNAGWAEFAETALGWSDPGPDYEDVNPDDILVDGADDPERLITEAENWNRRIDDKIDEAFQKVADLRQRHPEYSYSEAVRKTNGLPYGDPDRVSTYELAKAMYSFADIVDYGCEYAAMVGPYQDLTARLDEESLQSIKARPEDYFIANISIEGE